MSAGIARLHRALGHKFRFFSVPPSPPVPSTMHLLPPPPRFLHHARPPPSRSPHHALPEQGLGLVDSHGEGSIDRQPIVCLRGGGGC